jgi:hypothetical protein
VYNISVRKSRKPPLWGFLPCGRVSRGSCRIPEGASREKEGPNGGSEGPTKKEEGADTGNVSPEAGNDESPSVAARAHYMETGDQLPAVVVGVAG